MRVFWSNVRNQAFIVIVVMVIGCLTIDGIDRSQIAMMVLQTALTLWAYKEGQKSGEASAADEKVKEKT